MKAIKENYDVNQIFKTRIKDYKTVASIYKFFESLSSEVQPLEETNIRFNMIENLTILPTQGKRKTNLKVFQNKTQI